MSDGGPIHPDEAGIRQLGDFILLEEIGRGGMGVIYRARQVSMDRHVALKVLPSFAGLDRESVARFQREAEAAGRLSHPGIVPIYGFGSLDGTHYYAMELVEGPSLYQLIEGLRGSEPGDLRHTLAEETAMAAIYKNLQETPVPAFLSGSAYAASCAALIMEVCGALTAAHDGKVIHRDLKPSNILVHPGGRPVLVDFGLARDELSFSMTQTGDAVGTPSYMAPEQAAGTRTADHRVDVYGIGATLYELLTLRPPFSGSHSAEIMQAILDEDPVPPRRINPRVPKALDTIVLKCLAKVPDSRYATTAELASDLRAFLSGGAVQARRPGVFEILGRRIQRNRRTAYVAAMGVMAALLVGLMVGLVILNNSRQAGRQALDNAKVLLVEGRPREAHAAYVQALVLLEDEQLVADTRLRHFREVFPVMYEKRRFAVLEAFLAALPPEDLDLPEYHGLRRKLSGMGLLKITPPEGLEIRASLRSVTGEGAEWRRMPVDGAISVGRYLLRVEADGFAPFLRACEIRRDESITLEPSFHPIDQVPTGMLLIDAGRGEAIAVDRTEYSVAQYADFLASIEDRGLQAELVPKGWLQDARTFVPVRGLSHRQARIAAAISGRHLMTEAEYLRAATAGLQHWEYPWGPSFDIAKVVGDPRYSADLAAVNTRAAGASPMGVLHLVGNVAEPLSAAGGQVARVAGGSYRSRPGDLTVHSRDTIADLDAQVATAGLRMARFMPPPEDAEGASRLQEQKNGLVAGSDPYIVNRWQIRPDGSVELTQSLGVPAQVRSLTFPDLDGFASQGPMVVHDDGGLQLASERVRRGYRVALPEAVGLNRLGTKRRIEPLFGLIGSGDGYCARVPLTSRARRAIDELRLPANCRVDDVWPAPDEQFYSDGSAVLVWYRGVEGAASRATSQATVTFRRDGTLTNGWPAMAPVRGFVESFFGVLRQRDHREVLARVEADGELGRGLTRAAIATKPDILERLGAFDDVRVRDVIGVGQVLTVELTVRHVPFAARKAITAWPMRLLLRKRGESFGVVRMIHGRWPDAGRVAEQTYRHAAMGVAVTAPEGSTVSRTFAAPVPCQVEIRPPTGDHYILVRGDMLSEGLDAVGIRARLMAARGTAGRPERLTESQLAKIGPAGDRQLVGPRESWRFRTAGNVRIERWTFLELGRRRFFVCEVAQGRNDAEAGQRLSAAESWFRRTTESLHIH